MIGMRVWLEKTEKAGACAFECLCLHSEMLANTDFKILKASSVRRMICGISWLRGSLKRLLVCLKIGAMASELRLRLEDQISRALIRTRVTGNSPV